MSAPAASEVGNIIESHRRWPYGYLGLIALGLLFLGYVLSAPLLHDSRGFPLRFQMPVWSAAREGPFSVVLKPYFKLCGVEFPAPVTEPVRESYE